MNKNRRSSNKRKGRSDATYVIDRLINNEQRIPTQPLYGDTTYWYNENKLKDFWKEPTSGIPKKFYSSVKGDPVAFANTRPEWYSENTKQIWVQEFEFSDSLIAFNSYAYAFADPDTGRITESYFYRRDVITGSFSFRNGDLKGNATAALRGWSGRGEFENRTPAEGGPIWQNNQYESYFYTEVPSGVAIENLGDLADFTSAAWQENASAQFPDNFSERIPSLSELPNQTHLTRYFTNNWTTTIFSSDLI